MGNNISLIIQEDSILKRFPDTKVSRTGNSKLVWKGRLSPTPLSRYYDVRMNYLVGEHLDVYVTSPKPLKLAKNEKYLPHVFSTQQQLLCLYYRKEWNPSMLFINTIIPWTSEWLFYYELWVGTGQWLGGGVGHSGDKNSS